MKKAILIIGMHRSGTSVLSGAINILGAYQGNNLMIPTNDNPKGYFENADLYKLNEHILDKELNGSSWDNYEPTELCAEKEANLITLIKSTLIDVLGNSAIIAIKDPRICLFLPLYESALRGLGYEIHYIKTHRYNNEIVKSLMARDKFTEEKCLKIIEVYNKGIDSIPPNTLIVDFSDLLNNTDETLYRIKDHLPFLNYSQENIDMIKKFLDKSLKHH